MAKYVPTTASSGYLSTTEINQNFTDAATAIENTLSRDGTSPNSMSANLDLNSNRILNLPDAATAQEPATKSQLDAASTATVFDASISTYTPSGTGAVARTVSSKLDEWVSVTDFGAVGDGSTDDTVAFQAAIDHVRSTSYTSENNIRGGTVYVPYSNLAYMITSINLYTGIALVGLGGKVLVQQPNTVTGTDHMIVCDGQNDTKTGQHEQSSIENFSLWCDTSGGDGLRFIEHDNNIVRNVHVHEAGRFGIYGAKKSGGTKNDGLTLDNVFVSNCSSGGVKCDTNGHYWTLINPRLVNNTATNITSSCVGLNIYGGAINAPSGGVGLKIENSTAGGCYGTLFEATSAVSAASTLAEIGDTAAGNAEGYTLQGCSFVPSGNTGVVTCIDLEDAQAANLSGNTFSANSATADVCINVQANSNNCQIDNPHNLGNVGAGSLTLLTDAGTDTHYTLGATQPVNPAFLATADGTQTNIATGSFVTVIFGTEVKDKGTNFASNTFTAPETGIYEFSCGIDLRALDSASTEIQVRINTSNRNYVALLDPTQFAADVNWWHVPIHVAVADMDKNDTAKVEVRQTAGTAQMDIGANSYFSGKRIG